MEDVPQRNIHRQNVFRQMAKKEKKSMMKRYVDTPIIKDEKYLLPDYVPTEVLHREKEIDDIAGSMNRIVNKMSCENIMIVGPPGTGKTVSMRYLLGQLEEYTQKIVGVYVNCWQYTTRFAILSKIAEELGMFVPRRGISVDEVLKTIVEGYAKHNLFGLIIVLDEFDRLFAAFRDESQILYDLTRSAETLGVNIIVITVSNRKELIAYLDPRIRSSFYPRVIEFSPYDSVALKDILKERAKYAFNRGVLNDEVIPLCAAIGLKKNGDARVAIKALLFAGRHAEAAGHNKVTVEDVNAIREVIESSMVKEYNLTKVEKKILNIIKKHSNITSNELYKKLSGLRLSERAIRYYIARLNKLGLVKSQAKQVQGRGRTRVFSLPKKPL